LRLAYQALASGGSAPAVLNAANEVAVDSFLKCLMPFTAIPVMIEDVMRTIGRRDITTLDDVLAADGMAREAAREWLTCLA
jgi:1-deoxy-D-xylulose-5-phosphate reductoisomerase